MIDLPEDLLVVQPQHEPPMQVILDRPEPPPHVVAPHSPDQIKALDALMTEENQDSLMAGLIGLWGGSMVLGDLVQAHLGERPSPEKKPEVPNLNPEI